MRAPCYMTALTLPCRFGRPSFVVRMRRRNRSAAPRPGDMTMRFLSMIRIDETTGQVPSEQLMADMGKLIEELTRTGQLVSTAGLRPTSEGVRVRLHRGGQLSVVDGPFTETKEVIGGYALLAAQSQ